MALRPRAVITTPYPTPAATARVLGVSAKRYRELRAMVTDALVRDRERRAKKRAATRRRAARRA
jgi:precorrin-6B methylase 1